MTWYQALAACANVGKRLPTTVEWLSAAAGTPPTATNPSCNTAGSVLPTGASTGCVSAVGAWDMVGNVMEWSADLSTQGATGGSLSGEARSWALGGGYTTNPAAPEPLFVPESGPLSRDAEIGFRCVR